LYNQAYIFVIFVLYGFLTGLLFDLFRVLRKSFKTPNFVTYIQDVIFWLIIGATLLFTIFRFNDGELRSYIFIGIALGILIYVLGFSKVFIKVSVRIIDTIKTFVKRTIYIVIINPIKVISNFLIKIIFKPILFMTIKFKLIWEMARKFIKSGRKTSK